MSKTKYHPILFSTLMVQAILEGRKTQTRRVVKYPLQLKGWHVSIGESENPPPIEFCPYEVGDVLWVRETFYKNTAPQLQGTFYYRASTDKGWDFKWKPSIFMPKEACRIFLKIKSIRVERLQSINEHDAKAEGAKNSLKHNELQILSGLGDWKIPRPFREHQFGFLSIWCTINGTESWKANPFVWVYEFEQIEKPLDFLS